ncbi:lactate utilization protein C [Virgibacillus byunsanensis]|uniref:Lactate utilization protein C n=1 Tax=Virgibacillus byunsanensis TaxID=570945 RepID=A0ABW3LFZ4_9BACI
MRQTGEVTNRDSFLRHLSNKLGRNEKKKNVTLPRWEENPQYDVLEGASQNELVEVFKQAAEKVDVNVFETTIKDSGKTLRKVLQDYGESVSIRTDDERFERCGLTPILEEYGTHVWKPNEESIKIAEQSGVGITFSDYTLAESATVALTTSRGKGRSVSLLPKTYIALIPKSTIVPRLTQVTDFIHTEYQETNDISSCIKFISGPSNSADIELSFVVGVHGPIKVTYIVIEDY